MDPDETDFAGVAVYDGTRKLGEIKDRAGNVMAVLADGVVLGVFEDRKAASSAIITAVRGGR